MKKIIKFLSILCMAVVLGTGVFCCNTYAAEKETDSDIQNETKGSYKDKYYDLKWKFNSKTGTLTYYGTGNARYLEDEMKFNPDDVKKVITKGNHPTIKGMSSFKNLEEVKLNSSVKRLGTKCFMRCKKLRKVKGMGYVRYINSKAFYRCYNLKSYKLSKDIRYTGDENAFGYTGIKSLVIPESAEGIYYGFQNMNKLKKVTVLSEKIITTYYFKLEFFESLMQSTRKELTLVVPDGQYKLYKKEVKKAVNTAKEKNADFDMKVTVKKLSEDK